MTRSDQRLQDLQEFARKGPIEHMFGVWKNPRTGKMNRLGGPDLLIIDDIQRSTFKKKLLTDPDRQEMLQLWTKKQESPAYEMTLYFKAWRSP